MMILLVVEDNDEIRGLCADAVLKLEPDSVVFESRTMFEAIKTVIAHPEINVILTDLSLPDATEVEVVEALNKLTKDDVAIVVITGQGLEYERKAIDNGAQGFIQKGFVGSFADNLVTELRQAMYRKEVAPFSTRMSVPMAKLDRIMKELSSIAKLGEKP